MWMQFNLSIFLGVLWNENRAVVRMGNGLLASNVIEHDNSDPTLSSWHLSQRH